MAASTTAIWGEKQMKESSRNRCGGMAASTTAIWGEILWQWTFASATSLKC
jgi:hypothetical protein